MQASKNTITETSATPARGFLVELDDWSESLAHSLAAEENIELTDEHMNVLKYLRKYYDKNGRGYNARTLLNVMEFEFGKWQGKKYLYELFPKGPVSQGCKLAGIPLPPNCNDPSFGSSH
ncbi:MAG: TusE/DsrC/DsvC family sulfur relay protein [Gammaproteobacteria bacterium]|nr:TusE/DsrC/DsvC family sulfur relay protein [Gammaproteobacteria bacterium]